MQLCASKLTTLNSSLVSQGIRGVMFVNGLGRIHCLISGSYYSGCDEDTKEEGVGLLFHYLFQKRPPNDLLHLQWAKKKLGDQCSQNLSCCQALRKS